MNATLLGRQFQMNHWATHANLQEMSHEDSLVHGSPSAQRPETSTICSRTSGRSSGGAGTNGVQPKACRRTIPGRCSVFSFAPVT